MDLSADQKYALKALQDWYGAKQKARNYISLGGYAGTGKSTLLALLREELFKTNNNLSVAFCSFTGKATRVLKQKLAEQKAIY